MADQAKYSQTKLLIIFLVLSVILNILLGLFSYSLYRFRTEFIFTEEFAVMAMKDVSRSFCTAFLREYPDSDDDFYTPFCTKLSEDTEVDTIEVNGEVVEID